MMPANALTLVLSVALTSGIRIRGCQNSVLASGAKGRPEGSRP